MNQRKMQLHLASHVSILPGWLQAMSMKVHTAVNRRKSSILTASFASMGYTELTCLVVLFTVVALECENVGLGFLAPRQISACSRYIGDFLSVPGPSLYPLPLGLLC